MGAPLSLGRVTEGGLECGYHGMVFNWEGRCTKIPGQSIIPPRACVRAYPVVERHGQLWIWMGEAEGADPDLVPAPAEDDDFWNWPRGRGMLPAKCNYTLLLQNLMDLTHLAYVHRSSIGGNPADHEADEVVVEQTPTGVKFLRTMRAVAAPGRYVARFGTQEPLDRWSEFEYVAPAVIQQNSGWGPTGGGVIETRGGRFRDKMMHAITPATEDSCYYFFEAADGAEIPQDVPKTVELLLKVIGEDVVMVEGQQQRLAGRDPARLLAIRSDRARMPMVRELERRLKAEQQSQTAAAERSSR